MNQGPQDEKLGIYISVPFCRHKCSFCNFASGVGTDSSQAEYVALLCDEIAAAGAIAEKVDGVLPPAVDSIYLGGGTPSLLKPEQLKRIFSTLRKQFEVTGEAEVTLEAAPGQILDETLHTALACGVNRVSLGVQTFVDRECTAVGRVHTGAACLKEFARLRAAGVRSVGADLIAGLPYQTEASWRESLQYAADASARSDLDHVSVYMFEVDDDSRLGQEVLLGGERFHAGHVGSEDLVARLYEIACEELPAAGFEQYEISNFARDGFRSQHNCKYWERASYLGFGLDAHSMLRMEGIGIVRWANPEDLREYAGAASLQRATHVGPREIFEEAVFLGLRLQSGLPHAHLSNFPREWVKEFSATAHELSRCGWMWRSETAWGLTLRGRLLSSEVFGELLAGVPA